MSMPFLKWAGGKRQLLPYLRLLYPKFIRKYYEPFLGGGAVFFDLSPSDYLISDSNPELINAYKCVATQSARLVDALDSMVYEEKFYYKIRNLNHQDLSSIDAAARTIYLNRTCFNGLYRVNKDGKFNVPFGKYKNPDIVQCDKLKNASKVLKSRSIKCMDFRKIIDFDLNKDDLIFLDPPYVPLEGYSDFKRYTKEQFYIDSHRDLAAIFRKLAQKKIKLILTNSNTDIVNELYKGFDSQVIKSSRNVSCKSSTRKGEDIIIHANI